MPLNPTEMPPLKQTVWSMAVARVLVQKSVADLYVSDSLVESVLSLEKGELEMATSLHVSQVTVQKPVVEFVGGAEVMSVLLQRTGNFWEVLYNSNAYVLHCCLCKVEIFY